MDLCRSKHLHSPSYYDVQPKESQVHTYSVCNSGDLFHTKSCREHTRRNPTEVSSAVYMN